MVLAHRPTRSAFMVLVLVLVGCGGGGGSPPADNPPGPVPNVSSFAASAGDTWVRLSWVNPSTGFAGVTVRRGVAACPSSASSGALVYDGTGPTALDTGLTNGTSYCYAAFAYDAAATHASGVTATARPAASWVSGSAGGLHTLAIKADGTLWAWGFNAMGQLGDGCVTGTSCYDRLSPGQVGSDATWARVSAGNVHSAAIKKDGTLWTWGDNSSGQIGSGCTGASCFYVATPTQVGIDTDWAVVAAGSGGFFNVAIKTDGTLWAWGENFWGQLGDGCLKGATCASKSIPTQVGTDADWSMVAPGANHLIALKTTGTLWAWGENDYGQLGDGSGGGPTAYRSSPTQVGSDTDWMAIAAGDEHSLAIKTGGTLWGWGANNVGQAGITCTPPATCTIAIGPVQVGTGATWSGVDGGFAFTLALKRDGTLWAWGSNSAGQLGNGCALATNCTPSAVPAQVGTGTAWVAVSAGGGGGNSGIGGGHSLAIQTVSPSGYQLDGWGANMKGQLGTANTTALTVPTTVRN